MQQKRTQIKKRKSRNQKRQSAVRRNKKQQKFLIGIKRRVHYLKKTKTWRELPKNLVNWFRQKETWGLLLFLLLLLFFFLRFGTHKVDGQSMAPTFQTGDRIIVKKQQVIQRYDIVTFEPKEIKGESYVKRIIGMPGDQIQLDGTTLYLLPEESVTAEGDTQILPREPGSLADGTLTIQVSEYTAYMLGSYQTIPKGHYFVEGDNRLHSDDSRVFGLVDSAQIEGVVLYRYYPLTNMGAVH
ncbi:signal peptidase I [Enterococcus sp. BWB1-3]|uniref:signal peptidase I n=1 Tax=unclassified Enterococcus TaxID=2608891 RepID=UPI00192306BF|nr:MULTISPECIES: signal peptidase I [unclassified Enterococcus]MBL1229906.1 signal peptidase I [Enterococcus sp. BWB1-3]MCB5954981.1 signal peptidase I [Enterococcus sp. CWB-B31]